MGFQCTMEFDYPDEGTARRILGAVEVDNEGFIEARTEGSCLLAIAKGKDLKSLVHTLDDFLACVAIAEGTVLEARDQDGGS